MWNIVAESDSASKYASNGTWMNPVARRELSKPVDGRANSSPSLSNGVKESRPVRTWALFFWGRQVESGSRAISKRSRFLSVGNCQRMARKSFPHPKEAKKDEKWQKEVPGGGFFLTLSHNAWTDRAEIFTERRGDTGARFARKNCTIEKKEKKKARTRSHSDLILAMR